MREVSPLDVKNLFAVNEFSPVPPYSTARVPVLITFALMLLKVFCDPEICLFVRAPELVRLTNKSSAEGFGKTKVLLTVMLDASVSVVFIVPLTLNLIFLVASELLIRVVVKSDSVLFVRVSAVARPTMVSDASGKTKIWFVE